jgi:hypothetical protein
MGNTGSGWLGAQDLLDNGMYAYPLHRYVSSELSILVPSFVGPVRLQSGITILQADRSGFTAWATTIVTDLQLA